MKNKYLYWLIPLTFLIGLSIGEKRRGENFKSDVWTGFYYPDKDNIVDRRTWYLSPPLYSFKECLDWVNSMYKDGDNFTYTCSQGCRASDEFGPEMVRCVNKLK